MSTNLKGNIQNSVQSQYEDERTINHLLDILLVVLANKRVITYVTLAAALISLLTSLLLPKIYEGTTRFMPAKSISSSPAMLNQFSNLAGLAGVDIGAQTSSDLYVGILAGGTIADSMIDRFDLMRKFGTAYRALARKGVTGLYDISVDKKSGIITITVEDKDPELAAQMSNAFVEELQGLLKKLAVTAAANRRLFFEEQLKETHNALSHTEDELRGFQESTGAIKIDEQAKVVIEGIARLQAQVAAKEIELRVSKTYATDYNRDVKRAEEELNALKDELRKLDNQEGGSRSNSLITTQQIPTLGTEYLRKLRDFKVQETLYEILLKQFEMARLEEAQDAPLIQIVDSATPADYKSKPRRAFIVIFATFLGFFFSVLMTLTRASIQRLASDHESADRLHQIKSHLMFWKEDMRSHGNAMMNHRDTDGS